jgi:ParB family chromosome partitioning protein
VNTVIKPSAKRTTKATGAGLGLDRLGGSLSDLLKTPVKSAAAGLPLALPLDLIDEDPNQPRGSENPGFSSESIAEIGATIALRGVKSPISVRENPDCAGRYLINHGARRYRGSVWAEKTTIPAFVDNDYNNADQVIENLQRDALTAREIADYIGRELAKGKKKNQIAKDIGKSASFISQHVTLLDLPEPIAVAFNAGRASDVTVINELATAYKQSPADVSEWLADEAQELTRGSVKLLRDYIDDKRNGGDSETSADGDEQETADNNKKPKVKKEEGPDAFKKAILLVTHDDRAGHLVMTRRPTAEGYAWIKFADNGEQSEVDLNTLRLTALLEG